MQKTILTLTVCAMLLVTFPATNAAEPQLDLTFTNAPEGTVFPSEDHLQRCDDQLALLVTDLPGCTFEDEVRNGFGYMIVGFLSINAGNTGDMPLTGSITAHVTSDSGREVIFTCTWDGGAFGGCQIRSGTFPLFGEGYSYDCYTEAGALGNWGECYIDHF